MSDPAVFRILHPCSKRRSMNLFISSSFIVSNLYFYGNWREKGLMLIPYHPQRMLDKNTGENKFSNGYSEYKHKNEYFTGGTRRES